ncbi:uncharacterized protein LOC110100854 [Dendrobium catenatum]|uniref:uncharacterized protein LOC110100854 n=1 Tax=Dendrobium catenatum TaxID=906689 RepID=UPI00109EEA65|nr:uncharacterized protein LOC110100854 [Dendrobium catenatum]
MDNLATPNVICATLLDNGHGIVENADVVDHNEKEVDQSNSAFPDIILPLLESIAPLGRAIENDSMISITYASFKKLWSIVMIPEQLGWPAHHGKQLAEVTVYFISNIGKQQSCNVAAFVPLEEKNSLQNAKWIKYLATFSNSEARANLVYDAIKGNYNCLSKAAANLTTLFKPVVALVDFWQGMWTFSRENYKLKYVSDAGGKTVDETISNHSYNVSNSDDMDDLYALLCLIDEVIDQTFAPEPAEYTLLTLLDNFNVSDDANFDFLINHSLWRYDKRVQNSSVLGPVGILVDLIEMFFPTENYPLTYFRNIAKVCFLPHSFL